MSRPYPDIGEALFAYMEALNISEALPGEDESWGTKLNRPPKSDDLGAYAAFSVIPARDAQETADTDFDAITYGIYVIFSSHVGDLSEAQIRNVVDIVRTNFRALRFDPSPFGSNVFNTTKEIPLLRGCSAFQLDSLSLIHADTNRYLIRRLRAVTHPGRKAHYEAPILRLGGD